MFERDGNFLPLCVPCHNTTTAKFDRGFSPLRDTVRPKIVWLNDERLKNQARQDRQFKRPLFTRYPR